MNHKPRCAHCRHLFVPNPRVKVQRFCAQPSCQRARKTQWQRNKMATDPDYQANQRESQSAWRTQHPGYWRAYRQRRPDYGERNRILQRHRDYKRRPKPLANMDVLEPVTFIQPGMYHLIPAVGDHLAKMDALSQKCRVIPIA